MIENIWHTGVNFFSSIGLEWILSWKEMAPLAMGVLLQLVLIGLVILGFRLARAGRFGTLFELLVEKVYEFFEEILEETGKRWTKIYVVTLFFVILISNLSSWVLDVIRVVFLDTEAIFQYIQIPTTSFEFNIAMALVSIALFLIVQVRYLGLIKFFHEYLPITGKGILDIKKGDIEGFMYWPVKIVIKLFDIAISLFVGLLDIVGILAKVISLSARLYGNMIAGGVLLSFLVAGVYALSQNLTGMNLPILAPIILYAQGLLVAVIQAFVFPLLVGIFMKLAQTEV